MPRVSASPGPHHPPPTSHHPYNVLKPSMKPTLLCIGALFASWFLLGAQGKNDKLAQTSEQPDKTRITLDVTRVNMLFTVSDKKGRFVTDLARTTSKYSKARSRRTSWNSPRKPTCRCAWHPHRHQQQHPRPFPLPAGGGDRISSRAVRPGKDALSWSASTRRRTGGRLHRRYRQARRRPFANLRPGGGTALYDAIFFACRDKLMQDRPREKFRRAMVVLGDGEDNQSRYTREQALEMAQKAEVVDLHDLHQQHPHANRRRQSAAAIRRGDRRPSFFPFKARIWSSRSRTSPTSCATSTTSSTAPSRSKPTGCITPSKSR